RTVGGAACGDRAPAGGSGADRGDAVRGGGRRGRAVVRQRADRGAGVRRAGGVRGVRPGVPPANYFADRARRRGVERVADLPSRINPRRAVFTARSFGKAFATSGSRTTTLVVSPIRRAYLPRTSLPKSERLYSRRSSSIGLRLAFFIDRPLPAGCLARRRRFFERDAVLGDVLRSFRPIPFDVHLRPTLWSCSQKDQRPI